MRGWYPRLWGPTPSGLGRTIRTRAGAARRPKTLGIQRSRLKRGYAHHLFAQLSTFGVQPRRGWGGRSAPHRGRTPTENESTPSTPPRNSPPLGFNPVGAAAQALTFEMRVRPSRVRANLHLWGPTPPGLGRTIRTPLGCDSKGGGPTPAIRHATPPTLKGLHRLSEDEDEGEDETCNEQGSRPADVARHNHTTGSNPVGVGAGLHRLSEDEARARTRTRTMQRTGLATRRCRSSAESHDGVQPRRGWGG